MRNAREARSIPCSDMAAPDEKTAAPNAAAKRPEVRPPAAARAPVHGVPNSLAAQRLGTDRESAPATAGSSNAASLRALPGHAPPISRPGSRRSTGAVELDTADQDPLAPAVQMLLTPLDPGLADASPYYDTLIAQARDASDMNGLAWMRLAAVWGLEPGPDSLSERRGWRRATVDERRRRLRAGAELERARLRANVSEARAATVLRGLDAIVAAADKRISGEARVRRATTSDAVVEAPSAEREGLRQAVADGKRSIDGVLGLRLVMSDVTRFTPEHADLLRRIDARAQAGTWPRQLKGISKQNLPQSLYVVKGLLNAYDAWLALSDEKTRHRRLNVLGHESWRDVTARDVVHDTATITQCVEAAATLAPERVPSLGRRGERSGPSAARGRAAGAPAPMGGAGAHRHRPPRDRAGRRQGARTRPSPRVGADVPRLRARPLQALRALGRADPSRP
jgi:hypothetical protein